MQAVSTAFNDLAAGRVRPINWRLFISFPKNFDAAVDFFTLDVSELDGPDFLQGAGDVVQEWDKYDYQDFSDRVIAMEWQHEESVPFSTVQSIADITLNNTDNFFTPGAGSDIDGDILPRRPVRIYSGFGNESIPVFIGLTDGMPEIDDKAKTAKFHCIDFMSWIFSRKINDATIFVDQRVDQILDELLQLIGLDPLQYELDVAFNTIPFAFFDNDTTFGDAAKKLMEAELGTFLLDENGILRFRNRQNFDDTPVYEFDESNTLELITRTQHDIINVVEIKADVRVLQPNQPIFNLSEAFLVPGNSQVEKFFDYADPVTEVDTPVFIANSQEDGQGSDLTANISIDSQVDFSKASKVVFENSNATDAWITSITVNGTSAPAIKKVYVREVNQASIDKYEEQVLTIDNEFIQSEDEANTIALVILSQFSEFGSVYNLDVKGNPALQTNDQISTALNTDEEEYAISKIQCSLIDGGFKQRITLRTRRALSFFTLDTSVLNGGDLLSF